MEDKYVISLDAIDLNLIPTSFNQYKGKEVTTIWTKKNLETRNDDYYEFVIKENEDDENSKNMSYVPCHICNLEIPKPYLRDHFKSNKHKIYKKVIDISLERMKNVINTIEIFDDGHTNDIEYFCDSCVTVVNVSDRVSHEKSIMHRNSLMVDKILNDFIELYNIDQFENKEIKDAIKKNTQVAAKSEIKCKDTKSNEIFNKGSDNERIIINKKEKLQSEDNLKTDIIKNNKKEKLVEKIPNGIKDTNSKKDSVPHMVGFKENLGKFIDYLQRETDFDGVKVLDGGYLELEIRGKKVKVFEMNFNGLKKVSKSSYKCIICEKNVIKDDRWKHLYEKQHVDIVKKPLETENCIRMISKYVFHCVLCNVLVQDATHVIGNEEHNMHFVNATAFDTKAITVTNNSNKPAPTFTVKEEPKETYATTLAIKKNKDFFCTICDIMVTDDYNSHVKTFKHKMETKLQNLEIHYLLIKHKETVLCTVCHTYIINKDKDIQEHLTSVNHIELFKKVLFSNNVREFKKYRFLCKSCNACVIKSKEIIHIQSVEHKSNNEIFLKKSNNITEIFTFCKDENIIRNNSFHCSICNIEIPNNNFNIYTHLSTDIHKDGVESIDKGDLVNVHYHIDLTKLPAGVNCMVCLSKLTLNEKNILTHINGNLHKQNYMELLDSNKIYKENDNLYYCRLCTVHINHLYEIIHCYTKKHLKNVIKMENEETVEVKNKVLPVINEPIEEISDKMYLVKDFGIPNEVFCIVCEVIVPSKPSNVVDHLNGKNHNRLYEKILVDNNIIKLCDDFHCNLCNTIIVTGKEIEHIATKIHQEYIKRSSEYTCKICNVNLSESVENINKHNNGAQHQKFLETMGNNKITFDDNVLFCNMCDEVIANGVQDHIKGTNHAINMYICN